MQHTFSYLQYKGIKKHYREMSSSSSYKLRKAVQQRQALYCKIDCVMECCQQMDVRTATACCSTM